MPKPTATINGPTTINVGVPASWTVESANAVRGTWSLTGPVQPGNPNWSPGDGFGGTWNVQGTFTLTLTVFNAADEQAVTSITFTVV